MNTRKNTVNKKLVAILALLVSGLLYAVAVFDPGSTPTITLGKYALKDRDLLDGPTKAYRSWFENGAWQGDLIEYEINTDGSRTLDHTLSGFTHTSLVGSNDDAALLALANDSTKNWLARATFLKKENDITDYWKEETSGGRRLFTYTGSSQIAFLWDNLSETQKLALDPWIIADPDGDPDTNDAVDPSISQGNQYFSPILNFVRGDRSLEADQTNGYLRKRYSLLGDITTSPLYIGPPRELFSTLAGYGGFRLAMSTRAGVIATPANDGILHFFAASDGSESMGYIPSMVIDKLNQLTVRAYQHTYFLDGEMTAASAQVDPTHADCDDTVVDGELVNVSACDWRTVLTGGGGAGFEGLFALDMTSPGYTGSKVLFEKTGGDFGHIYGAPRVAPLGTIAAPDWYIFTGNGYKTRCSGINNSVCDTDTNHPTALLMVSLANSDTVHSIDTGTNGGLSAPVLVNTDDSDVLPEIAFAGDINGDLWMFRLDKDSPGDTEHVKVFNGVADQPITNTPAVVKHPNSQLGGYIVYFGTGSIFSQYDALNDGLANNGDPEDPDDYTRKQAMYGIHIKRSWIEGTETVTALDSDDLQVQTLNDPASPITATYTIDGVTRTRVLRTTPNDLPVNYVCSAGDTDCADNLYSGWKLNFPICGERLVGAPFVRAGRVQFVTNNPTGTHCGGTALTGDSWMMSLNYLTGASANEIAFNLNGDSYLNALDTVDGVPPVGLGLGQGNIAQPAFVRLRDGIDKMFINGIILPVPPIPAPGPLLFGHLDVVTDSPAGGVTAANLIYKHSEGYQEDTSDGLGQAIDGHFHDYDTINGISYVDLFEIEPRRGLASLAPTTASTDASGGCGNTDNAQQIQVGDRCIEAVEAELNRAYDTLTPTIDEINPLVADDGNYCPPDSDSRFGPTYVELLDEAGEVESCERTRIVPESEAYDALSLSGGLFDENQPFVVNLVNADLTPLADLQIGCRIWEGGRNNDGINELIQYQDHLAAELESGAAPSAILDPKFSGRVVFSLASIARNQDYYGNSLGTCTEDSPNPTLRILFDEDAILRQGIHATRAQCVLGLHNPDEKVCYSDGDVLTAASTAVLDTRALIEADGAHPEQSCGEGLLDTAIPDRYIKDPSLNLHITPTQEGGGFDGYRWRNGALTVQLLAVHDGTAETTAGTAAFTLQPRGDQPHKGSGAKMVRIGGTYAKGFNVVTIDPARKIEVFEDAATVAESGLLYEASMFWHFSDLADNIQRGTAASIGCYGYSSYGSALAQEERGLNLGQYQEWRDALEGTEALAQFASLLATINNPPSEELLNQALLQLADLLANNDVLREYAQYRDYVPGSVIPEQQLLDIDKNLSDGGNTNTSTYDAVPGNVISIETIDLESLGPNAVLGRRNWIDLRQ